jgi:uncharacterized membrane protein
MRSVAGAVKPTGQSADDILAERLARGEIDEDDYTRRRELLRNLGTTIAAK